jgi:hypothetical protein
MVFVGLPRVSLRGQRNIGRPGSREQPRPAGARKADKSSHEGRSRRNITAAGQVVAAEIKSRHLCAQIDMRAASR